MKDMSDKLKSVKTTHELPESLEDVDFEEIRDEFDQMKDLIGKMKDYPYERLPEQMKDVDFDGLETQFGEMETVASNLSDMPIRDKWKDMDLSTFDSGVEALKGTNDKFRDLPSW
jgi:hypothetical protein